MFGAMLCALVRENDALLKAMPEGIFAPSLAELYMVSPDSRVYEFKLRKGVKWTSPP